MNRSLRCCRGLLLLLGLVLLSACVSTSEHEQLADAHSQLEQRLADAQIVVDQHAEQVRIIAEQEERLQVLERKLLEQKQQIERLQRKQ